MMKLLLALIMMFALGTSTVNAEKNTASIEDRIDELAETKTASQSTIEAKIDELSEDELKTVIANVNELTEQTGDDLAIKDAAISKLEGMKNNPLAIGIGVVGLVLMFSAYFMVLAGYDGDITVPLVAGVTMIVVTLLLAS